MAKVDIVCLYSVIGLQSVNPFGVVVPKSSSRFGFNTEGNGARSLFGDTHTCPKELRRFLLIGLVVDIQFH